MNKSLIVLLAITAALGVFFTSFAVVTAIQEATADPCECGTAYCDASVCDGDCDEGCDGCGAGADCCDEGAEAASGYCEGSTGGCC